MQYKMNRKEEAIYVDLGINSRLVPIHILRCAISESHVDCGV